MKKSEPEKKESMEDAFLREYQELCRKYGMQVGFEPRWGQSKDQGDYRLVIIPTIVHIPREV